MNKPTSLITIAALISFAIFGVGCTTPPPSSTESVVIAEPETDAVPSLEGFASYEAPALQMLSPAEMAQDFAFLVDTLRDVHPTTIDGFTPTQESLIQAVETSIQTPLSLIDYVALLSHVAQSVKDPQTAVSIPESLSGPQMPVAWLSTGLFVVADTSDSTLRIGDQIVAIAEVPVDEIALVLEKHLLVSASRAQTHHLGPQHLFSDALLALVGFDLRRTHVPVRVVRQGEALEIELPRITEEGVRVQPSFELPTYALTPEESPSLPRWPGTLETPEVRVLRNFGSAYLRFDVCEMGPELEHALDELFTTTTIERLSTVIVDLRYNLGGEHGTTRRFLRYLGVREYPTYSSVTRYSPQAAEARNYSQTGGFDTVRSPVVRIDPLTFPAKLFQGQVYVLISNHTGPEAARFATLIKENDLGVLVGEPAAAAPGYYGQPLAFRTPSLGIDFAVAHRLYISPAGHDGLYARSLAPDVLVETTIEDIRFGFDAQVAYALRRAAYGK